MSNELLIVKALNALQDAIESLDARIKALEANQPKPLEFPPIEEPK